MSDDESDVASQARKGGHPDAVTEQEDGGPSKAQKKKNELQEERMPDSALRSLQQQIDMLSASINDVHQRASAGFGEVEGDLQMIDSKVNVLGMALDFLAETLDDADSIDDFDEEAFEDEFEEYLMEKKEELEDGEHVEEADVLNVDAEYDDEDEEDEDEHDE